LLALSSPAFADAGQTAQSIAKSIANGETVSEFADISTDFAADEILELAACEPRLGNGSTTALVYLSYICHDRDGVSFERTLELLFDQNATLVSAWLPADVRTFAPSEIALNAKDIPSKEKLERAFIKAVEEGSDISLAGLIPLPFEKRLQRLVSLADCKPMPMQIKDRQDLSRRIIYSCANSVPNTATLVTIAFDEDGHPLGLTMQTVTVSIETITRTVPVGL
jgi:hypothetical protein